MVKLLELGLSIKFTQKMVVKQVCSVCCSIVWMGPQMCRLGLHRCYGFKQQYDEFAILQLTNNHGSIRLPPVIYHGYEKLSNIIYALFSCISYKNLTSIHIILQVIKIHHKIFPTEILVQNVVKSPKSYAIVSIKINLYKMYFLQISQDLL